MLTITSLSFDTKGWNILHQSSQKIVWTNHIRDLQVLTFFREPIHLPQDFHDTASWHTYYEQEMRRVGGAIVSLELSELADVAALKLIFKFRHPKETERLIYLGSWLLPLKRCSYVIKVQCIEHGVVGLREASVLMQQAKSPHSQYSGVAKIEDLLALLKNRPIAATLSDDERYDKLFPQHPLSRVRTYLAHIQDTLYLEDTHSIQEQGLP